MNIELTTEQAAAVATEGEAVVVIDPNTKRAYRLVPEDVYRRVSGLLYDATPWTPLETSALAAAAFGKLDDTDYSDYLRGQP